MAERNKDWAEQAERDLRSAKSQIDAGFPEEACFIAPQGAEKAIKSVLQRWGAEAWGHSLIQLFSAVSERADVPDDAKDAVGCAEKILRFCNCLLAR